MTTQREHLRIGQTAIGEQQKEQNVEHTGYVLEYPFISESVISWLFPVSSWFLIWVNGITAIIAMRDMWNGNYNPLTHYFMTSAFTLTIGALAVIHTWILKKRK